jgi:hypothetical protein
MTDRGVDLALGYFEAIFWRKVDAGDLQPSRSAKAVFRQRGFWARRNTRQETSRDRYNHSSVSQQVSGLELALAELGFNSSYCAAIRRKVTNGRTDDRSLWLYSAALHRTLKAKQKISGEQSPG